MQVMGLFSGIGGFELGFRRAGFTIAGVCEIEPYACRVLEKHFPEAQLYKDVKELTGERLRADGIRPFVVTGGFPCQDISLAGKGAGLGGERSGLWFEMHRVIAETRPQWVVAENVAALRSRGLDQVLGSLAAIGYDAEWHCIPASAVGAPHRRDRIWLVAYPQADAQRPNADGLGPYRAAIDQQGSAELRDEQVSVVGPLGEVLAYPNAQRQLQQEGPEPDQRRRSGDSGEPQPVADAPCERRSQGRDRQPSADGSVRGRQPEAGRDAAGAQALGNPHRPRLEIRLDGHAGQQPAAIGTGWWQSEPTVGQLVDGLPDGLVRFAGRVATGVPNRVQKLRALGNAVVPQIPEIIAHAIRDYEFV